MSPLIYATFPWTEWRFQRAFAILAALVLTTSSRAVEKPFVPPRGACSGNMTLLVLTDSSAPEARSEMDRTLLCALDHFGMPYRLLDLAKEALSSSVLNLHAAVVMAQPGLGRRLSPADVSAMEVAVEKGVGLVNFDGLLSAYPVAYAQMLGVTSTTTAKAVSVRIFDSTHPITQGNSSGHEYELVQPVDVADVGSLRDAEILLCAGQGQPAAFAKRLGQGKVVQFTLASKFWLPEYFGHVKLYVFSGSGLAYQFKEIPAFEGAQSVVVE